MADSIFREKQVEKPVEQEVKTAEASNTEANTSTNGVETPYLDTPDFLDNYFKIGSEWHDRDATFYPEVAKIGNYVAGKITNGEVANSQEAVKNLLKGMEKLNNLKGETRSVVKLEVLSNYIEFLVKNDHLKSNLKRYAN